MGWAVGWDPRLGRYRGYGVPAYCDYPECREEIDRGFSYSCCDDPFADTCCGGFFCSEHQGFEWSGDGEDDERICPHTDPPSAPEHPEWLNHVLTDESWAEWRSDNPDLVSAYRDLLNGASND